MRMLPFQSFRAFVPLALVALALLATGCATVKVADTTPREYLAARRGDVLSTGQLSHATTSALFSRGIARKSCERDASLCIQRLFDSDGVGTVEDDVLAAIAELATAEAIRRDATRSQADSSEAIARFLKAARYAYAYLFRGTRSSAQRSLEERQTQVRDYYNYASERVVQLVFEQNRRADREHIPQSGDVLSIEDWVLTTGAMEVHPPLHATGLEAIVPASALKFEGLRNTYRRDGFGAELVAVWHVPADAGPLVEIAYHPATVLLGFEGETDQDLLTSLHARIDIFDPYQRRTVRVQGADVALAGNFTSPYGLWLARSRFRAQALRTLFGRSSPLERTEVLMMQPYDPQRLTVVLIHGLAASPDSWVNVANEIMGDERLRDRYQIWQVYYPTNLPLAISQLDVRKALEETFATLDQQQVNVASHHIALVVHSMGGIIARLLVSTGGEKVWEERYQAPEGSERRQRLARLEPYVDLHPLAGVDRAIFLACPHAGTPVADNWLSRRVASLVYLPAALIDTVDRVADSIASDLPEAAQTLRRHPNAINQLDSKNAYMQITAKLPIAPGITYHQIIARKDPTVPLERSSDGLVPYQSAYLPGAESTLVVESSHHVQDTAPAILEIRRILLLHSAAHTDDGPATQFVGR
jgi:pimeloyl-ACP methyl ester carboxylesterase